MKVPNLGNNCFLIHFSQKRDWLKNKLTTNWQICELRGESKPFYRGVKAWAGHCSWKVVVSEELMCIFALLVWRAADPSWIPHYIELFRWLNLSKGIFTPDGTDFQAQPWMSRSRRWKKAGSWRNLHNTVRSRPISKALYHPRFSKSRFPSNFSHIHKFHRMSYTKRYTTTIPKLSPTSKISIPFPSSPLSQTLGIHDVHRRGWAQWSPHRVGSKGHIDLAYASKASASCSLPPGIGFSLSGTLGSGCATSRPPTAVLVMAIFLASVSARPRALLRLVVKCGKVGPVSAS